MDPAWDEFRRRRRAFWLAFPQALLWVALGSSVYGFLASRGLDYDLAWLFIVALPAQGCIMVAHWRKLAWPCPNCGRPFHATWFYANLMARQCVHCDLPKPKWPKKQEPVHTDFA